MTIMMVVMMMIMRIIIIIIIIIVVMMRMMIIIPLFLLETQIGENRPPVDSFLCVPSRNVPGLAIIFLYAVAPLFLWPFPLPTALWVPSQGGAVDLIIAFSQDMAESSKSSSSPNSKVNITGC
jgi:hypothetical protein